MSAPSFALSLAWAAARDAARLAAAAARLVGTLAAAARPTLHRRCPHLGGHGRCPALCRGLRPGEHETCTEDHGGRG